MKGFPDIFLKPLSLKTFFLIDKIPNSFSLMPKTPKIFAHGTKSLILLSLVDREISLFPCDKIMTAYILRCVTVNQLTISRLKMATYF